ncbi:MAG TPA: TonB-dependent receptor, partial [Novosphingobium sp.]|nr:TonB-dependent receptor [Novosphingobium sp.]
YDNVVTLGNTLEVVDGLKVLTGVSLVNTHRIAQIAYISVPILSGGASAVRYNDWTAAPRLGLNYSPVAGVDLFGTWSQSVNPVATWGYSPSTASFNYVKPLVNQNAFTFEAGGKIRLGRLDGSLTYYRSAVHNEFLTIVVPAGVLDTVPVTTGYNGSPTLHQGVEAGLNAVLWKGRAGQVRLRQSYTWTDVHFRADATYRANTLPGVPAHLYQAELLFDASRGFYAGGTLRASSGVWADYANTLKAPAYTVFGLKAGWRPEGGHWSVFVDAQNLADKRYVSAIGPVSNAAGTDALAFYPGDGRSVTAGINLHF